MLTQLRSAISMFLLLTLLTGVAYPLLVTGIAQTVFPHQSQGSLLEPNGVCVGSSLIGRISTIRNTSGAGFPQQHPSRTMPEHPPEATWDRPTPIW